MNNGARNNRAPAIIYGLKSGRQTARNAAELDQTAVARR